MAAGKVSPAFRWRVVPVQTGGGTTMPNWALSTPGGRWTNATTNTMNAVGADGFTREVLRNYNGAALLPPGATGFPKGGALYWGGGHSASGGGRDTATYGIDMDARLWKRVSENSAGPFSPGGVGTYPQGVYSDGKPVPTHTYCYPGFDPVNNLFFIPRAVSSYVASTQDANGGAYLPFTFILDIATGVWRYGPTTTGAGTTLYRNGGRTVWDSRRGCLWTMPCNTSNANRLVVKYFDLNVPNGDGTWGKKTDYPFVDSGGTESDAVFLAGDAADGSQDLIVYTQFTGTTPAVRAVPFNAAGVPQARITLTQGGTPPVTRSNKAALMWSKRRQSILYYDSIQPALSGWPALSGPSLVYELRAPTGGPANWRTGTWTWNLLTDQTGSTFPQADSSTGGFYSKARLIEYTDGEVLVAATRSDTPAYAFRIP